tara:strand:+ start:165 stop:989 length:825 start_codon:yes stop_codon:yes gene_type:complete
MCSRIFFYFLFGFSFLIYGCDFYPIFSVPKESVSGVVRITPQLKKRVQNVRTLFLYLQSERGGPPLGVQKLINVKFPYHFIITKNDSMMPGVSFSGRVLVRARLDADGIVGPLSKGDFEGVSRNIVEIGTKDVNVVIAREGKSKKISKIQPSLLKKTKRNSFVRKISGVITIDDSLVSFKNKKSVLYIIAKNQNRPAPVAVVRILSPSFPLKFELSEKNVMIRGVKFDGRYRIIARLDSDGIAGPVRKGDMEGISKEEISVGSSEVRININKKY